MSKKSLKGAYVYHSIEEAIEAAMNCNKFVREAEKEEPDKYQGESFNVVQISRGTYVLLAESIRKDYEYEKRIWPMP